ncbi:hypothetical protein DTO212C5_2431 [Paecilomyces variotii]|nr:hypothetical protein DTO212C5_2431 [Paecilomyces variotii]
MYSVSISLLDTVFGFLIEPEPNGFCSWTRRSHRRLLEGSWVNNMVDEVLVQRMHCSITKKLSENDPRRSSAGQPDYNVSTASTPCQVQRGGGPVQSHARRLEASVQTPIFVFGNLYSISYLVPDDCVQNLSGYGSRGAQMRVPLG